MRVDAIEFQVSQETRKFRLKLMDQRPGIGRSELRNQVSQFEETYRAGLSVGRALMYLGGFWRGGRRITRTRG